MWLFGVDTGANNGISLKYLDIFAIFSRITTRTVEMKPNLAQVSHNTCLSISLLMHWGFRKWFKSFVVSLIYHMYQSHIYPLEIRYGSWDRLSNKCSVVCPLLPLQDCGASMRTAVSLVPVPMVANAALCQVVATHVPVLLATQVFAALTTQMNVQPHPLYARMKECVTTRLAPTSEHLVYNIQYNYIWNIIRQLEHKTKINK